MALSCALALALMTACAGRTEVEDADLRAVPETAREIPVRIDNQHFSQATVIVHVGTRRIRLGEFEGKTSTVVTFPYEDRDAFFEVRLLADERTRTSDRFRLFPDDAFHLTVDPATGFLHVRRDRSGD